MIFPSLDFYRELILTADPHAEPFYTPCGWLANGPPHVHRCARHSAVPTSSNSGCIPGEERQSRPLDDSGVLGRARSSVEDRKSTRLNSSHLVISYAVFCLKKKIS